MTVLHMIVPKIQVLVTSWRMETGAQMMRTRMSARARLTRNKLTTVCRLRQVATERITWRLETNDWKREHKSLEFLVDQQRRD